MGVLEEKVILVTGATSGIGAAVAIEAAREGAAVVLTGRREGKGNAVVAAIRDEGGEASFVRADVSEEAQVRALVTEAVARYGGLDGAFNNAGVLQALGTLPELATESFDRLLDVNLRSIYWSMKYEIPELKKRGGGAIVNASSIAARVSPPGLGAYVTTKHGILGLTRGAASDHAQDNIRVNAILPGPIETEIWDPHEEGKDWLQQFGSRTMLGRTGRPVEVAKPVVFLLSDGASYITATELVVDGGYIAL